MDSITIALLIPKSNRELSIPRTKNIEEIYSNKINSLPRKRELIRSRPSSTAIKGFGIMRAWSLCLLVAVVLVYCPLKNASAEVIEEDAPAGVAAAAEVGLVREKRLSEKGCTVEPFTDQDDVRPG